MCFLCGPPQGYIIHPRMVISQLRNRHKQARAGAVAVAVEFAALEAITRQLLRPCACCSELQCV
jgi:hypothetical protein